MFPHAYALVCTWEQRGPRALHRHVRCPLVCDPALTSDNPTAKSDRFRDRPRGSRSPHTCPATSRGHRRGRHPPLPPLRCRVRGGFPASGGVKSGSSTRQRASRTRKRTSRQAEGLRTLGPVLPLCRRNEQDCRTRGGNGRIASTAPRKGTMVSRPRGYNGAQLPWVENVLTLSSSVKLDWGTTNLKVGKFRDYHSEQEKL